MEPKQSVLLPLSVITQIDLSRIGRELTDLDEYLLQASIRTPGTPMQLPRLSKMLDDTAQINKLNLLDEKDRKALLNALLYLKDHAPKLHISFSAEPNANFVLKIAEFIRTNIHPLALIQVGLQPTIAAGCILRTPNRQFDLSLRQHLKNNRQLLGDLIHQTQEATQPAVMKVVTQ